METGRVLSILGVTVGFHTTVFTISMFKYIKKSRFHPKQTWGFPCVEAESSCSYTVSEACINMRIHDSYLVFLLENDRDIIKSTGFSRQAVYIFILYRTDKEGPHVRSSRSCIVSMLRQLIQLILRFIRTSCFAKFLRKRCK